MKIIISRNASVRDFYVQMDIGIQQNRGDIIAYAKLAQENGNILTAEELNQKFLGKSNTRIATFLLDYCVNQNLFRRVGEGNKVELTETGKICAEQEIFYERSSDIFHIQYLDEEYSENKLLSCERLSSRKYLLPEDVKLTPVPPSLKNNLENNLFDVPSEEKAGSNEKPLTETILIYALGEQCVEIKSGPDVSVSGVISENCQLQEWVTENKELSWNRNDIDFSTMLRDILENTNVELDWSKHYNRLVTQFPPPEYIQVSAAITGDVSLNTLKLKHYVPEQNVDIQLTQCPLMPASIGDAKRWYYHLIEESIRYYVSESEFINLIEEKIRHFEDFSEFFSSLELPQRKEFAAYVKEKYGEKTALYWYIMTPLDLSLEGIV